MNKRMRKKRIPNFKGSPGIGRWLDSLDENSVEEEIKKNKDQSVLAEGFPFLWGPAVLAAWRGAIAFLFWPRFRASYCFYKVQIIW